EARKLAETFRRDAAERDRLGGTPKAQRDLIRASGLLKLIIPTDLGGLGGTWPELLRVVRELATADASLAHLFAYHHLRLVTPNLIGPPAQRDLWYSATAKGNLFWGNSLNPLDPRTTLTRVDGSTVRHNGEQAFCLGTQDSDVGLVSAPLPGERKLQVAVLPARRQGIDVHADWD